MQDDSRTNKRTRVDNASLPANRRQKMLGGRESPSLWSINEAVHSQNEAVHSQTDRLDRRSPGQMAQQTVDHPRALSPPRRVNAASFNFRK